MWKSKTERTFLSCFRYIKIFAKFPDGMKAFWDDSHYIHYVDPHVRGRYQLWQNLEEKGDVLENPSLSAKLLPGRYHPRGTNVLMCTIVGNNWQRVTTLSKQQVALAVTSVSQPFVLLLGNGRDVRGTEGHVR